MGTNYYVEIPECKCCGHAPDPVHVGKSSGGWKFLFARHDDLGLISKATWCEYLHKHNGKTRDEYGGEISSFDLVSLIEKEQENDLTGLNCYEICGCCKACEQFNQNPMESLDSEGYRISTGCEFS